MAKKNITANEQQSDRKLRTKDLIYAGAFGAIYIVLMLAIVLTTGAVPVLYILEPLFVGIVCATVYELCVIKVHKFGAALILGILFAAVACSGYPVAMVLAVIAAVLAELVMMAGGYRSKKMFLLSFVVFNLNMVCPFAQLYFKRDEFLSICENFYGADYAAGVEKLATAWLPVLQIALAVVGALIGVAIANKLIKKHFEKAGIV